MIYAPRRAALRSEMDSKLRAGELSAMRAIINERYRENLLRALLRTANLYLPVDDLVNFHFVCTITSVWRLENSAPYILQKPGVVDSLVVDLRDQFPAVADNLIVLRSISQGLFRTPGRHR